MRARTLLVPLLSLLGACGGRVLEQVEFDERQVPDDELACAAIDYAVCVAGEDEPFAAIGLGCSDDFGEAIVLDEPGVLTALDPDSWRVAAYLGGSSWGPRRADDDRVLLLTTGRWPPLGEDAGVIAAAGSALSEGANQNPDGVSLPEPIDPDLHASALLFDQVSLRAALEVPAGVRSLAMDIAWFSAEYPEFVASPFGDLFMVWSTSEAFTGNLALVEGATLTAGALAQAGWMRHVGDDPALSGTGFEGHGGSGWMRLRAPVVEGERVELVMVLADVGDAEVGSAVVLDDLRWGCGCGFDGEGERCGLTSNDPYS